MSQFSIKIVLLCSIFLAGTAFGLTLRPLLIPCTPTQSQFDEMNEQFWICDSQRSEAIKLLKSTVARCGL